MNWVFIAVIAIVIIILFILGLTIIIPQLLPSPPATVNLPTISPTPTPQTVIITPTPSAQIITPTPTTTITTPVQTFIGSGFTFSYPESWSILTCANSLNFELDPGDNIDELDILCDFAFKSITFLISNNLTGCQGEVVTIGNVTVIKSITQTPNLISYNWCTQTSPVLKISHRTGSTSSRAVGLINYSPQIEAIIASLKFTSP